MENPCYFEFPWVVFYIQYLHNCGTAFLRWFWSSCIIYMTRQQRNFINSMSFEWSALCWWWPCSWCLQKTCCSNGWLHASQKGISRIEWTHCWQCCVSYLLLPNSCATGNWDFGGKCLVTQKEKGLWSIIDWREWSSGFIFWWIKTDRLTDWPIIKWSKVQAQNWKRIQADGGECVLPDNKLSRRRKAWCQPV